jgi:hypothetical protein
VATGATSDVLTTPFGIQLSNDPATAPDTLSGPVVNRFRTLKGSGLRSQGNVSFGVFYRF